jgi:hypothetical protein
MSFSDRYIFKINKTSYLLTIPIQGVLDDIVKSFSKRISLIALHISFVNPEFLPSVKIQASISYKNE